jgi:hypothetical protein
MYFEHNDQRYYMVIGSPLMSFGYKELTFDEKDFVHMYNRMTAHELHQYVGGLLLGFGPDHAARSV